MSIIGSNPPWNFDSALKKCFANHKKLRNGIIRSDELELKYPELNRAERVPSRVEPNLYIEKFVKKTLDFRIRDELIIRLEFILNWSKAWKKHIWKYLRDP